MERNDTPKHAKKNRNGGWTSTPATTTNRKTLRFPQPREEDCHVPGVCKLISRECGSSLSTRSFLSNDERARERGGEIGPGGERIHAIICQYFDVKEFREFSEEKI